MNKARRGCLVAGLLLVLAVIASRAPMADPLDAAVGKALFDRNWIPAPSSTKGSDGLGPLFTARSCVSCHASGEGARVVTRDDGTQDLAGAVVRFGRADGTTDPYYGRQLQTNAVPGMMPEGSAAFLPHFSYRLNDRKLTDGVRAGARLSSSLYGRAAFERVPDEEILKRADPDDRNHDGISGRANRTPRGIGRYGWKAAQVTLEDQIADAFALDIGMSSPKQPLPYGDCTKLQTACLAAPNGDSAIAEGHELSGMMLHVVASYLETFRAHAPPPDPAGAALFDKTGCTACHVPALKTRSGKMVPAFTDLLLHDMGAALDDGVGEPGVKSSEWRTAPLIEGKPRPQGKRYLHDGSAATIAEAIAKHGGEAARSRASFEALTPDEQTRLIDYVDGL